MSDDPHLWTSVEALRGDMRELGERLARVEENARSEAATLHAVRRKVDEMYTLAIEARGAGRLALALSRFGWTTLGAAGAFVWAHWANIKKLFG